jgi:hypothetical protein
VGLRLQVDIVSSLKINLDFQIRFFHNLARQLINLKLPPATKKIMKKGEIY